MTALVITVHGTPAPQGSKRHVGNGVRTMSDVETVHPDHNMLQETVPGFWEPAKPIHPRGLLGVKVRRACRRSGGHYWHPVDVMIAWFCCQCGAERDGMPRDGS